MNPAAGRQNHCVPLRRRLRHFAPAILLALLLLGGLPRAAALQDSPAVEFYQLVNRTRLNLGLAPFGSSTLLTQAAQRHADDIVNRGVATHAGADGSDYRKRIREAGYRAWNDGLLVDEAVWLGLGKPTDALNWFYEQAEEWTRFTDTRYREIGVGYAEDGQGVHYFVITFGARPGVLPIFINDGAAVTDSPLVAVRLTNENAEPLGEGSWIGKAIEVQLSNTPDFSDVPWQPWEELLPWSLAGTEPGDYSVYVQFRDGAGRTTVAEATIRLVAPGEVPPTSTPWSGIVLPTPAQLPTGPETPAAVQPTVETGAHATATPPLSSTEVTPLPTWTPLVDLELQDTESKPATWPLLVGFLLQGVALLLGIAAFLRRR
ncbi:MAG TPA: CAP domain-containing protein [Anaerolineae bacterium]|nr:CAP domain-containing protein [Anaerolineae bacterium]HQH39165.1 CAP domain-containing protein [Anaerolineae bacterium]